MRRLAVCFLALLCCLLHFQYSSGSAATQRELEKQNEASVLAEKGTNSSEAAVDLPAVDAAAGATEKTQVIDGGTKLVRDAQNASDGISSSKEITLGQHAQDTVGHAPDASYAPPRNIENHPGGAPEALSASAAEVDGAAGIATSGQSPSSEGAAPAPASPPFPPSGGRIVVGGWRPQQHVKRHDGLLLKAALLLGGGSGGSVGTGEGRAPGDATASAREAEGSMAAQRAKAPLTCDDLPCGEGQLMCYGPIRGRFVCTCRLGFELHRWGRQAVCVDPRSSSSNGGVSRSSRRSSAGTSRVQGAVGNSKESKWTIVWAVVGAVVGVLLLGLLAWGALSWHRRRKDPVSRSVQEEFSSLLDDQSSTKSFGLRRGNRSRRQEEEESLESEAGEPEETGKQISV
ncbi:LOW QUALITY PROTEIN: uncharacterized protein EMH_0086140 [Eimeria mitis]|uniref:EGF-like domain-containing protein n=1 Tax=Eimeria mitis TaxID=44415 RepID=U6KJM4_9EIME|nr:LOW QUALITY PROTEIN: uncharacterized protein EMH_0086140 [Eimeria mitis]CDJ36452.1 hypothetical protein, conserved [Eimeria mitis]